MLPRWDALALLDEITKKSIAYNRDNYDDRAEGNFRQGVAMRRGHEALVIRAEWSAAWLNRSYIPLCGDLS